jgi:hypothetical protein
MTSARRKKIKQMTWILKDPDRRMGHLYRWFAAPRIMKVVEKIPIPPLGSLTFRTPSMPDFRKAGDTTASEIFIDIT